MTGVNVSTVQQGYAVNACCKACHNKIAYERRKKKMQERYGVDNPF
jgi:very-short-patch-repair endonuclease